MKPFAFQTVLDYRKRLEDTARQRLAAAKKAVAAVEQKLREEQDALTALIARKDLLQTEGINILELLLYEEQISRAQANITAIDKNLLDKTELLHQEQQHLLSRAKDRRIMERLKERQDLAWKGYLDKKELAMLDEIAITRHDSDNNH